MSNVKNVEALARLVSLCTGLGGSYNPGQQNLQLENLQTLLSTARAVMLKVSTAKTNYENAGNQRELLYKEIRLLVTRIIAELKASGALQQTTDDAHTMVRKITGKLATTEVEVVNGQQPGSDVPSKRRARGADPVSITHHFEKLLQTLAAEPKYAPSAAKLKMPQLKALLTSMRNANQLVTETYVAWKNACHERNAVLYGANGSLFTIASMVKNKVKAEFGFSSDACQDALKIRFTKPPM